MASFYGEDASKQALRDAYLELPSLSPSHQARLDADVLTHLRAFPRYKDATLVLGFASQREEADTAAAFAQALADGKRVALAQVAGDGTVTFYEVADAVALKGGVLGRELAPQELDASICLVPGLVFDAEGYRVAYGAGYVDNFLKGYRGLRVALARSVQISSNPLPKDPHDEPVDVIVSDAAVWMCRRGV